MINPATRFIALLFFVKNPITVLLHCAEINANKSKGRDIPTPKNTKLSKFVKKSTVDVLIANKTISDAGLHGRTIAPKNKPKIKALNKGFFLIGAFTLGNNLPISKLNIIRILIKAKRPKAIGLIIPIAFVKDSWSRNVNINPKTNIEIITPEVTTSPNLTMDIFGGSELEWSDDVVCEAVDAKKDKNPGYNGNTQTAKRGADNPAKNESQKLSKALTI